MTPSIKQSALVLVGNPDVTHVGAHLAAAARALGRHVILFNADDAFAGNRIRAKLNWWIRGHRPSSLRQFSNRVVEACCRNQPESMLATGIAPLEAIALKEIGKLGVRRLNYLTDDPWNPCHRAPWFMEALCEYDHVFSPRSANIEDLRRHGCQRVSYMPFAYAPDMHFRQVPTGPEETRRFSADVAFAGGADPDRAVSISALTRNGFRVALYGGYWQRYSETRAHGRGHADPQTLRKAIAGAKVALCLVRRANRDGHSMRTFEVAAMGGCMLAEDTEEHRLILGEDGDAVVYFRSVRDMVEGLRWLLANDHDRLRLGLSVQGRITAAANTYRDRLTAMLALADNNR